MWTPFDRSNLDFTVAKRLYRGQRGRMYQRIHQHLENTPFPDLKVTRLARGLGSELIRILEVGAGSGEHLKFVNTDYDEYWMSDISNSGKDRLQQLLSENPNVQFKLSDVQHLDFPDDHFDRVIATCLLAHVDEPFRALLEIRRVLKVNGNFSLLLTTDPSITLRIFRRLLVRHHMKELGVPYETYIAVAHRNSFPLLRESVNNIFSDFDLRFVFYPTRVPLWNLSTHCVVHGRRKSS
jgi:ubiquinone/menaquinone biosynthesis C-methylase UbiE